jgi:DNA polymerase sigma
MKSNPQMFKDVELVVDARVPVIRSIHTYSNIEIDITLDNILV